MTVATPLPVHTVVASPVGPLTLLAVAGALTGLYMADQRHRPQPTEFGAADDEVFTEATAQLDAYFAGRLTRFDLPLAPQGTPWQQQVWTALRAIPYASTTSYGALAADVGSPGAARAVGLANGRNPLGIVVPCHRVIGATGALTGYGGGMARKQWLLSHEARHGGPPGLF